MNGLLHGNLGYSYKENQTVAALFGERRPAAATCPASRCCSRS